MLMRRSLTMKLNVYLCCFFPVSIPLVLFTSLLCLCVSYRYVGGWVVRHTVAAINNSANVDNLYEKNDSTTEVYARTQNRRKSTKKGTLNLSIDNFPSSNTKRNGGHNITLSHTHWPYSLEFKLPCMGPALMCLWAQCASDVARTIRSYFINCGATFHGLFSFWKTRSRFLCVWKFQQKWFCEWQDIDSSAMLLYFTGSRSLSNNF